MKIERWVVHCIAECQDCKKEWEHYRTARALALRHAKKYKHRVHVEVGTTVIYDARAKECKP